MRKIKIVTRQTVVAVHTHTHTHTDNHLVRRGDTYVA